MTLDLSKNGKLSVADSILIDNIAPKVVNEYSQFSIEIIRLNNLRGMDLISSAVSRNPFHSEILSSLCKLSLLEEKLKKGDRISVVVIENQAIYSATREIIDKYKADVKVVIKYRHLHTSLMATILLKLFKSLYWISISWLWPKMTGLHRKHPKSPVVFVDSFIFPNSFDTVGEFIDRYYTGYDQYLNDLQRQKICYSPTLFGFRTLGQCLKVAIQSKKSTYNFLFQESWLTFSDYFYALYLTIKIPLKVKRSPLFRGVNVSELLLYEAKRDILSPLLAMAVCKLNFIREIRKAGVDICQVVDWHENQAIDKTLNLGFHKYYPGVIIKGYQGYASSFYEAHKIPCTSELESLVLPDKLYVLSNRRKQAILKNCPDLEVYVASAFRFSYLYSIKKSRSASKGMILVALPMNIDESISILSSCIQLKSALESRVNILVKHHPAYDTKKFGKQVPDFFNAAFTQTNDSMAVLLGKVSALISSASSVCVEADALGIPVAIYGNCYGVTMNPIYENSQNGVKNVFYSDSQLIDFIRSHLSDWKFCTDSSLEEVFLVDNGKSSKELFTCQQR